jgi:hypothetical protein
MSVASWPSLAMYGRTVRNRSRTVLIAILLAATLAVTVVAAILLGAGPACELLTYGGPVRPSGPRTSCDPPWVPSTVP